MTCARSSSAARRSGYYSHWVLTEAQGQTFADVEIGIEPIGLHGRVAQRAFPKSEAAQVRKIASTRASGRALSPGEAPRGIDRPVADSTAEDLDPDRVAGELPHQRRARLRRDRASSSAAASRRGVRARRRDRLLRHRRAGVRRHRPGHLGDVRGPQPIWPQGKKAKEGSPEPYPWRVEAEPVICPRRGRLRPRRGAGRGARARRQVAAEHWHLAFQGQLRTIGEADATPAARAAVGARAPAASR